MTADEMRKSSHQPWNVTCKPDITNWLLTSQSQVDKERLKACGNNVIPQCARLALHVIASTYCMWVPLFQCTLHVSAAATATTCEKKCCFSFNVLTWDCLRFFFRKLASENLLPDRGDFFSRQLRKHIALHTHHGDHDDQAWLLIKMTNQVWFDY